MSEMTVIVIPGPVPRVYFGRLMATVARIHYKIPLYSVTNEQLDTLVFTNMYGDEIDFLVLS